MKEKPRDGFHYYWSNEQNRIKLEGSWQFGGKTYTNYCQLADGRIVEYTEGKKDNTGSNFDDAVYLGQGHHHHGVAL